MRKESEMMELIMKKAREDDRIRAVAMDGSRANKNAVHDQYSDFDIVYFVTDVREFTKDKSWVNYFGEILILQCPMDWYLHPYDYSSSDSFTYLIQFTDGNRIDLTLIDVKNIEAERSKNEPRIILLNKDNFTALKLIENEEAFFIQPPSEMEFHNTTNEFRWLSLYIAKGLCREEFYYVKYCFDVSIMKMFMKMLNWTIGLHYDFKVTTGAHNKYLKRYLSDTDMKRVQEIFPDGSYTNIWDKLFLMYDYFHELEGEVAEYFHFICDKEESKRVREFLLNRKWNSEGEK